jgi:hypothetical protein
MTTINEEQVVISLSVAEWNAILGALSTAPFQVINQISEAVNALQTQAGPQVEAAAQKHASAEAEAAE